MTTLSLTLLVLATLLVGFVYRASNGFPNLNFSSMFMTNMNRELNLEKLKNLYRRQPGLFFNQRSSESPFGGFHIQAPFDSNIQNNRVIRKRTDRFVTNNMKNRYDYTVTESFERGFAMYICQGVVRRARGRKTERKFLDLVTDDRSKALVKCGFEDYSDTSDEDHFPNNKARDQENIYNNFETFNNGDVNRKKRERNREAFYRDDKLGATGYENFKSFNNVERDKNSWSSSNTVSSHKSFSSGVSTNGPSMITIGFGDRRRPRFDTNFDPRKFGSFRMWNRFFTTDNYS